ncbi:hypothetical protein [Micromonospora sp. NPDC003241]
MKETVTAALRQAVEAGRVRRKQALADLEAIAESGGFHFDRLDELDR